MKYAYIGKFLLFHAWMAYDKHTQVFFVILV